MKNYIFLLSALALINFFQVTQAADCASITEITGGSVNSTGFVTTRGKPKLDSIQLVDASNQPLQLIGVSAHNILTFADCYTYAALQHLVSEWGITVFRITVYLEEFNGYFDKPTENDAAIAQLVSWCETLGIYAIINYHVHEIGDPNHYLDSQGASTGPAITFWQAQATAYLNKDHVLYEIANEPNNVDWQPNLVAYLNSVIAAIRAIDSETIIIAGTPQWSQALYYPGNDGGVTNTYNVMYAFHFYAAAHLFLYDVVEQYSRSLPIFSTEWSPSSWDSVTEPNLDNSDVFTSLFSGSQAGNPQSISSTAWTWGDKGGEEVSLLTSGACGSQSWGSLTCSGKYVKNYIRQYRLATSPTPTVTPTVAPTIAPSAPTDTTPPSSRPSSLPSGGPSAAPSSFTDACVADPSLMVKVHKKP
jgi:endoglucanase